MKIIGKIEYNGEYMPVREDGVIARQGSSDFSESWQCLGAVRFNNFGQQVESIPFRRLAEIKDWQYKNGSQKWHIRDLNHGTMRVWMSPKHKFFMVNP